MPDCGDRGTDKTQACSQASAVQALNLEENSKELGHISTVECLGHLMGELTDSKEALYMSQSPCFLLAVSLHWGTYPKESDQECGKDTHTKMFTTGSLTAANTVKNVNASYLGNS